jgi:hypothetical protein
LAAGSGGLLAVVPPPWAMGLRVLPPGGCGKDGGGSWGERGRCRPGVGVHGTERRWQRT